MTATDYLPLRLGTTVPFANNDPVLYVNRSTINARHRLKIKSTNAPQSFNCQKEAP